MEENILDIEKVCKSFILPDKNRLVILQDLAGAGICGRRSTSST